MKRARCGFVVAALAAAWTLGCGGSGPDANNPKNAKPGQPVTGAGVAVNAEALAAFNQGLDSLKKHDEANDWTDALCEQTAEHFMKAREEQGTKFLEAVYNAGVAYQRCKNDEQAKKIFTEILEKDDKYHRARVQLALYAFKESGEKDVEGAIAEMNRAVRDAEYNNIEALVQLAMLQMRRQSDRSDEDGANDLERAKKNLQRALAINDGFMPAFNQLAIYYFQRAKDAAGQSKKGRIASAASREKRADTAALELAQLVVSQAIRKNPNYGPVYNTSGLTSAELGDLSAAAQAFGKARQLDPKFFEANMNYGAVNLQFRGFQQAEAAYRDALKLRPNDYEARLGLALALRGQINDSNYDQNLAASFKELEAAKKIDPSRPETYFNEAILVQEFKSRGGGEKALLEAKALFNQFMGKAGGQAEFKDAVKQSEERIKDIDQIIEFNRQSAEDKKRLEEMQKQQAAQEQMNKGG